MVSEQLLTKTLFTENFEAAGTIREVRFNLPRGKVARILGGSFGMVIDNFDTSYSIFVRKARSGEFVARPQDMILAWNNHHETNGINWAARNSTEMQHLPKPYRCTAVTVQHSSNIDRDTPSVLILYYDVDDMIKDEDVQHIEKSVLRGVRTG